MTPMKLSRVVLAVLLSCVLTTMARAEPFPRPPELAADIDFWRRVFAEIDSNQALLHDSRQLEIVYTTVSFPPGASAGERRRISDQNRDRYRALLEELAVASDGPLTAEQRQVKAVWPSQTTAAEFREAAQRIRLQQGLSDRFRQGLQRSGAWRPYIDEQLARNGVPLGLGALPHVESSFNPEARSHVGAAGLWQFIRSTGLRYMTIDHVVDERRDPFASSAAAAKLLAYNYSVLDSWPLAISAYNHGASGMRRAVADTGTRDIVTINREYKGRAFGFASRNFYVAFLAALEVEQDAEKYFGKVTLDKPASDIVFKMPEYVPANALAAAAGITLAQMRASNPALLEPVWSGAKLVPRNFQIRIPTALSQRSRDEILAAIPVSQLYARQTPDQFHQVQRGESLSVIAARYNASVNELVALNGLKSQHMIRIGQNLRLPVAEGALAAASTTYKVRSGDSLSLIAGRAGLSEQRLMELNGLTDRNRIYAGQVLSLQPRPVPSLNAPVAAVAAAPPGSAVVSESTAAAQPTLSDPNDYSVAADNSIEVNAAETLGHIAEWLGVSTARLRELNGQGAAAAMAVGQRLRLDFSRVSPQQFTARRIAWHREMQDSFWVSYRVTATTEHRVRSGESLWVLTHRRYKVPEWLVRQYNPELNFSQVQAGMRIVFPQIEPVPEEA